MRSELNGEKREGGVVGIRAESSVVEVRVVEVSVMEIEVVVRKEIVG